MNASRRSAPVWAWPVLAVGIAGNGACSAPAPPQQAPSQDAGEREPDDAASRAASQDDGTPAAATGDAQRDAPAAGPVQAAPEPAPGPEPPEPSQPTVAPRPPPPPPPVADAEPATLTVTMLSRGKGVPDEARAAYADARAWLEQQRDAGIVTAMRAQRIGLEGETRLCAEFRSEPEARAALDELRKRVAGVDLLDASLAPCPPPQGKSP